MHPILTYQYFLPNLSLSLKCLLSISACSNPTYVVVFGSDRLTHRKIGSDRWTLQGNRIGSVALSKKLDRIGSIFRSDPIQLCQPLPKTITWGGNVIEYFFKFNIFRVDSHEEFCENFR